MNHDARLSRDLFARQSKVAKHVDGFVSDNTVVTSDHFASHLPACSPSIWTVQRQCEWHLAAPSFPWKLWMWCACSTCAIYEVSTTTNDEFVPTKARKSSFPDGKARQSLGKNDTALPWQQHLVLQLLYLRDNPTTLAKPVDPETAILLIKQEGQVNQTDNAHQNAKEYIKHNGKCSRQEKDSERFRKENRKIVMATTNAHNNNKSPSFAVSFLVLWIDGGK